MTAEARIDRAGLLVAIRKGPNEWRVSNGGLYRDVHVADWRPLLPADAIVPVSIHALRDLVEHAASVVEEVIEIGQWDAGEPESMRAELESRIAALGVPDLADRL